MTITDEYKIILPTYQEIYQETLEEMRGDLERLDAFGDATDDARWFAGDTARKYIDDEGLSYIHVCAIIGKRMGYAAISIKNFLACSRFYYENGYLLSSKMDIRYSIMAHAAKYHTPKDVLNYAQKNNSTIETIKSLFPVTEKPEKEPIKSIFGVEFRAIKRWGYKFFGEKKKERFEAIMDELATKLQELLSESPE